jgi:hypothetical protein
MLKHPLEVVGSLEHSSVSGMFFVKRTRRLPLKDRGNFFKYKPKSSGFLKMEVAWTSETLVSYHITI